MPAYCTPQDLHAFGLSSGYTKLSEACEVASRIVDDYCGQSFDAATSQTVTFSDVRTPLVRFGRAFSNITGVTINGASLSSSAYIVEPWGVRLYMSGVKDVDGFPRSYGSLHTSDGPYGAQVAVTATFGFTAVPAAVKRATVLIAAQVAREGEFSPSLGTDEEGNVSTLPEATMAGESGASLVPPRAAELLDAYKIPLVA